MPIQIENDRKSVEELIVTKKVDPFIKKYQQLIFSVIDSQLNKFDSTAVLSSAQKNKLMMEFLNHLLSKKARLLHNYLSSQKMDNTPTLYMWLHRQCVLFFSAKFIIDGILSRNINVINTFFFSKTRPGCREMFVKWISDNNVFCGNKDFFDTFVDRTIEEYVNVLYVDIDRYLIEQREINEGKRKKRRNLKDYERAELTTIINFHYYCDFYSYFRDYVMRPYLVRIFFGAKTSIISIDDDGRDEGRDNKIELKSSEDPNRMFDSKDFLERIFQKMNRTAAGRRQVEILKLLNLETDGDKLLTEEEIAKMLNIKVSNLRMIQSRGLDVAKEIGETLEMD